MALARDGASNEAARSNVSWEHVGRKIEDRRENVSVLVTRIPIWDVPKQTLQREMSQITKERPPFPYGECCLLHQGNFCSNSRFQKPTKTE